MPNPWQGLRRTISFNSAQGLFVYPDELPFGSHGSFASQALIEGGGLASYSEPPSPRKE